MYKRQQQRTLGAISLPKVRDSYIQTVKDAGLHVDAETADLAARKSMGHPYMLSLIHIYARDAPVEYGDKDEVQANVEDGGHGKCLQRHAGDADGAEDRGLKVVEQDRGHAEQKDAVQIHG